MHPGFSKSLLSTLTLLWNKDYVWRLSNIRRLAGATTGLAALVSNLCGGMHGFGELVLYLSDVLQGMCPISS